MKNQVLLPYLGIFQNGLNKSTKAHQITASHTTENTVVELNIEQNQAVFRKVNV